MTERTKIERVGGHLLIGDEAFPIALISLSGDIVPHRVAILVGGERWTDIGGWTAREILEVAYGPQVDTEKTIADLRATVKVQREENAVLREALRRVVLHYTAEARNGDGIMEDAWDDVAAAMTLADSDAVRFDVPAIERGLASIHEAAGV